MRKLALLVLSSLVSSSAFASTTALENQALSMIERLEESGYGTRSVCIFGTEVYGLQPGSHWSKPSAVVYGTIQEFPKLLNILTPKSSQPYSMDYPSGPADWSRFKIVKQVGMTEFLVTTGTRGNQRADICIFESKPVLE